LSPRPISYVIPESTIYAPNREKTKEFVCIALNIRKNLLSHITVFLFLNKVK